MVPHAQSLNPQGKVSLSAWVRPRSLPSTGTAHFIVGKDIFGASGGYGLELFNNAGTQEIVWLTPGNNGAHFAYALPINVYSHVMITQTGTTAILYVNGASIPVSFGTPTSFTPTTTANFVIGGDANVTTGYFDGDIDDVRLYNREVSAAEARALAGYHPMQVTGALTGMRLFLQPEAANYANGACAGGINCVNSWPDSSMFSQHLAQATAVSQPSYDLTGMNGKPALRFVGDSNLATNRTFLSRVCDSAANGLNSKTNTIFAVLKETANTGNNGVLQNGAPNSGKLLYMITPSGARTPALFDLSQTTASNMYSTATFNSLNEIVLLGLDYDALANPRGNLYKNGYSLPTLTYPVASDNFSCGGGSLDIGRYYYGGTYPNDGSYFEGFMGDIIYFNTVLPTSQRRIVECYLSAKYGQALDNNVICD